MRKFSVAVMMCLLGLLAVIPASAQTLYDNWCYDGQPLAGRCGAADTPESRWMWYYGFYRAQVANGTLTVNDIPEEYRVGFGTVVNNSNTGNATVVTTSSNGSTDTSNLSESDDFIGWIAYCEFEEDETDVYMGWVGLEVTGDEIRVTTDEGSDTRTVSLPLETNKFRVTFDDPVSSISEGGKIRIYRDGVLIGKDTLNSIQECEDDT